MKLSTRQSTEPSHASRQPLPTESQNFRLGKMQAARWLDVLQRGLDTKRDGTNCLEQLRDQLKDACWLGRWKREHVLLELCPSNQPSLFKELLQLGQGFQSAGDFEILEEMSEVLLINDRG